MLTVRRAPRGDVRACVAIVEGLPEFFTRDVPDEVATRLVDREGWVLVDAETVAGFAIVDRGSLKAVEILYMAIAAERRGRGEGTAFLEPILESLAANGVAVVEVETLAAASGYEPYRATRAFWERRGFVHVDTIPERPGWQPDNPAAIYYIAALAPTR